MRVNEKTRASRCGTNYPSAAAVFRVNLNGIWCNVWARTRDTSSKFKRGYFRKTITLGTFLEVRDR